MARESATLEFKRDISKTFPKTVSAFANYGTGRIVFGVDDGGGPVGLADPRATCLSVENAINDSLSPVPDYALEVDEERGTVTLTVREGREKPYLAGGKAYRRADSSTVEVSRTEYNRLCLAGLNLSFDSLESADQGLSFARLEGELVRKAGLQALDRNALVSLELMGPDGAYNNAAALLADVNGFPGTDMARFGDSISIILSRRAVEGVSLLEQMDRALEVFDEHYSYEEVAGFERVERSLVPRNAFREALANALVHRRWDLAARVRVAMFPDRIEVTSPGGLPDGVTEEEYVGGGLSISRNPILANVFYRLGYVERFGTGIPRIVDEYAGLLCEPGFLVRGSSVTVVLPVEGAVSVDAAERRVLSSLPKGVELPRADIEAASGLKRDKTVKVLNSLMEKGLVARVGSGRSTRYTRS